MTKISAARRAHSVRSAAIMPSKPKTYAWFILLLFVIKSTQLLSQPLSCVSVSADLAGNTGINRNGLSPTPVGIGFNDPHWRVSTINQGIANNGSGPQAVVIVPPAVPINSCLAWSGNQGPSNFPYNQWISVPGVNCNGVPGNYGCINPPVTDAWFRTLINLPPNPMFQCNWTIWASDYVADIYVNGVPVPAWATSSPMNLRQNGIVFKWCDWISGTNTVVIHVKTTPLGLNSACRVIGLKVEAWGNNGCNNSYVSGPSSACAGTPLQYYTPPATALGIPTTVPVQYAWSKPPGFTGNSNTNILNTTSGPNSGVVSVKITTNTPYGKSCVTVAGISVTIPGPLNIAASTATMCQSSTVTFTASGATTYTWYAPWGVVGNGAVLTQSPPSTTTYTLKATKNGCLLTKLVTITVYPNPVVSISTTANPICSGQTAILQASGASSYTWIPSPAGVSSIAVSPNVSTNYVVKGRSTNGCTATANLMLVVNPTPTITMTANPNPICPGQLVILNASGGTQYNWNSQGWSPTNSWPVSPLSTTTYTVAGMAANGCTAIGAVQVTISIPPSVVVSPPMICPGVTNTMSAAGAITYTWTLGTAPNTTVFNGPVINVNLTSTTPYTVCGTGPSGCVGCVTGTLSPGIPIPISTAIQTLCTNAGPCTTLYTGSSLNAPVNFTWMPSGMTGTAVVQCPTVNTTYTISASSPSTGCPSSATMAVVIATNCCIQSTLGLTVLPSLLNGVYANGSFLLDASTTLGNNASFQNCEVWMTPDVDITVPSGLQLDLDHTHMFACGLNMWTGIIVKDGGMITTPAVLTRTANSMIEDAKVAIDLDQISFVNASPNTPIDIHRILFNKNHSGIRIANSVPTLSTLALAINGCVFTSHDMTFTTFPAASLQWPSTDMFNAGGLRVAINPTTGLAPPYVIPFTPATLKSPYNGIVGQVGIRVENIGDPNGITPTDGVEWGYTYTGFINDDFNLFDGLQTGVDITDASVTSRYNVFQNMQYGVRSDITQMMNARLALKGLVNTWDGNRFWDCITGIRARNVYECWTDFALFRSTHSVSSSTNPIGATPGDIGVDIETNRFDFTVFNSEFNNLRHGIIFNTPAGPGMYDFGAGPTSGVYARAIDIHMNYFGPEVLTSTQYSGGGANTSEYMGDAIQINTPPLTPGWFRPMSSPVSFIVSNKIDRTFRGILINGFEDQPMSVIANSVNIEDDFTFGSPAFGYGIAATENLDNLAIRNNTVTANVSVSSGNFSVSLVYCDKNYGTGSPAVQCNTVTGGARGFHFNDANMGTSWEGNAMCDNWIGLALTSNGIIGQQGSPGAACGNLWNPSCGPWGLFISPFETYCDNSNANLSTLYVEPLPGWTPVNNGNSGGGSAAYGGPNLVSTSPAGLSDCIAQNGWPPVPSWRTSGEQLVLNISESRPAIVNGIQPNPSDGKFYVKISETERLHLRLIDITGKLVYEKSDICDNCMVDISHLPAAVYIVEVRLSNGAMFHTKLILTN
jgi:hypothetical protein